MLKKFQTYIEQGPWEEALKRQEKWINKICWFILLAAALYFFPICIWTIHEVKQNETQINVNNKEKQEISQLPGNAATNQDSDVRNTTKQ